MCWVAVSLHTLAIVLKAEWPPLIHWTPAVEHHGSKCNNKKKKKLKEFSIIQAFFFCCCDNNKDKRRQPWMPDSFVSTQHWFSSQRLSASQHWLTPRSDSVCTGPIWNIRTQTVSIQNHNLILTRSKVKLQPLRLLVAGCWFLFGAKMIWFIDQAER